MAEEGLYSDLSGRTALVTGATSGIGHAVATRLSREGARVGVVARTPEAVDAVARSLGAWSLPCDVADASSVLGMARRFTELADGPPDILVTSAGVFSLDSIESVSESELDRNLAVNLKGSILTVQAFLPALKLRASGTIIQVGSIAGRRAFPGNAAYSASKFGLRGFHEVLLEELQGTGVRATLLEPAAVDTAIWDEIDRGDNPGLPARESMLEPSTIADCVAFVAGREPGIQIPVLPVESI